MLVAVTSFWSGGSPYSCSDDAGMTRRTFGCMGGRQLVLLATLAAWTSALEFAPYQPTDAYKCGDYKKGRVKDQALGQYYVVIRQVIASISQPFAHAELLNDGALLGDPQEWQSSFEHKYPQWLQFQEGPLAVVAGLLVFSFLFPLCYVIGRCLHCCCSRSSKKKALGSTDGPWDGCKRHCLNAILIVFVLVDVFAAAALLVTGQYAEYGLEELPTRLNQCIDDLNLYKRETDAQMRKLLIDDWRVLNDSLVRSMDTSGQLVVDRVKKVTGAHGIDVFLNISEEAKTIQSVLMEARQQLDRVQEEAAHFTVEFNRLRKTARTEIDNCLAREDEAFKVMCRKASEMLSGFDKVDVSIDTSFLDSVDHNAVETFLLTNVSSLLTSSNNQFLDLGQRLQSEIDVRTAKPKQVIQRIGDDLMVIAEKLSARIRQVNFDPLYSAVAAYTDGTELRAIHYVRYSWYASLVVTALFILLSLCFLFGLFYGLCGRRASYYDDDCCVRSTGSKFYGCGIWLSIFLFAALAICAAGLFFAFANVTHLVCDPLERPLARADMTTLADRYVDLWNQQADTDVTRILSKRDVAELVRGCQRNETFYQILDLDNLYHLNQLEDHEKTTLAQLDNALAALIQEVNVDERMGNFLPANLLQQLQALRDVNVSQLSGEALNRIQDSIAQLDLVSRLRQFEESIPHEGKPQAVSTIIVQVDAIDREIAAPLRARLQNLHANLTRLNDRLSDLRVPVDSLLGKLQHAQVLLSADVRSHVVRAAQEVIDQLKTSCQDYITHVKKQIKDEITSCAPVAQTMIHTRDALCANAVDPINGSWMSMLVCLAVTVPIVLLCTALAALYNKIYAYPNLVHEPGHDHVVSSFITDTYDSRRKPVHQLPPGPNYANYSFTGDYQTPYLR